MKKNICIIFANIVIFSVLIVLANFFIVDSLEKAKLDDTLRFFRNDFSKQTNFSMNIDNYPTEQKTVKVIENNEESYNIFCGEDRHKYIKNSKNPSIITLGCSYTYGHGLKKEETFPSQLSILTKYNVFNYALCGGHIAENIQELNNHPEFLEEINDVDYVIYTYMYDHINRFMLVSSLYRYYEFLFDNAENKVIKQLLKVPLFRLVLSSLQLYKIKKDFSKTEKIEETYKNILKKAIIKIKGLFPNAKFIFVLYNEKIPDDRFPYEIWFVSQIMESKIWDELEKEENIQVVRTRDVMGFYFDKDYKLKEDIADWHPSARAWREFTPKFVSQYIK